MLKFADKHLHSRYSWIMKTAIRTAIFGRAAMGVTARAIHTLARPALEFAVVFATVSMLGWLLVGRGDGVPPALFFGSVALGYALLSVGLIGMLGGYEPGRSRRLRDVWKGVGLAMIVMAAVSFFVKDIAFSRLLLLLSPLASGGLLSVLRLASAGTRSHQTSRALLVGSRSEAGRFATLLASRPDPPFSLVGYVAGETEEARNGVSVPYMGPIRQLRDIARLRRIDEVVFSAGCLSNQDIFQLMQQLQSLPVQFRILSERNDYVIGKSSIDDLSTVPLVDARLAVGRPRSAVVRRAFEIPVAIVGILVAPFVMFVHGVSQTPRSTYLLDRMRLLPDVLLGRKALVGYDEKLEFLPPEGWRMKPGVFSVVDSLLPPAKSEELNRAYWFYVQNQSASMDWDIIHGSIRRRGR
jgi:O-antigen biosynthesis protein